ncbi:MAG: phosphoenolpyruvate--protein phosphotransferase [Gammaproteobacteria bacterium]|nr:MAG: phosphoenolpyruvate--protein phosphotransferase [Gammaproteobacteria bacterium]
MSLALCGIGVSKGIAMGKLLVLPDEPSDVRFVPLPEHRLEAEIDRLRKALDILKTRFAAFCKHLPEQTSDEVTLLDLHCLMLQDKVLIEEPIKLIRTLRVSAEWALKIQCDALLEQLQGPDPYLESRRQDIQGIFLCLQRLLQGKGLSSFEAQGILLVHDMTLGDALLARQQGVVGVIAEHGGPMSHAAILMRSLGMPAVMGLHGASDYLVPGEDVVVDGHWGSVLANLAPRELAWCRQRQQQWKRIQRSLRGLREKPAKTRDGIHIVLRANIELPSDVDKVKEVAAEGVGLYRSEALFMHHLPDEEEQFQAYREVVEALQGKLVTLRTLDLAIDKPASPRSHLVGGHPLGLRGIRLCLHEPALLLTQLRAMLRASAFGTVRLLIPMLTSYQEILQVKEALKEAMRQLSAEGLMYDAHVPLGAMVEVPALAVCADLFAPEVDFLSIGTNDLIQYALAVDRTDEAVSGIYDPFHPAIVRLIRQVVEAGKRAGIPVALCGEMASDVRCLGLLMGLGLREFSVPPGVLPEIKRFIRKSSIKKLAPWAEQWLACPDLACWESFRTMA